MKRKGLTSLGVGESMENHKKNKSPAGFAIIELVVIIFIITVLALIVISDFLQIKIQFSLSRVAYKFDQDLRKAQNMALSAVQYEDSFGNMQLVYGYGVYIDFDVLGQKKYIIYADKNGNQEYDGLDYVVQTIDFSSDEPGIIIKELFNVSGSKVSINFNSSDLNTKIAPPIQNRGQGYIHIVFAPESDLTNIRIVLVTTSGLIEIKQ